MTTATNLVPHRIFLAGRWVDSLDIPPCAGVKDSGLGREDLRYAIEDMTGIRILVLAKPG